MYMINKLVFCLTYRLFSRFHYYMQHCNEHNYIYILEIFLIIYFQVISG